MLSSRHFFDIMTPKKGKKTQEGKEVVRPFLLLWNPIFPFLFTLNLNRITWTVQAKLLFVNEVPDSHLVYETAVVMRRFRDMNSLADHKLLPSSVDPLYFSDNESGVEILTAIYSERKAILVLFRGTDEINDWNVNLAAVGTGFGPTDRQIASAGMFHAGFNKVFEGNLLEQVVDAIDRSSKRRSYRLVFAGYSKGAAEALLMASYLSYTTFREAKITVLGYGSPRVGDKHYNRWLYGLDNLSVWNFVRRDDPVCRLPPESWGYESSGHLVQLDDDGAKAYYRHYGDLSLGFLGVQIEWYYEISIDFSIHSSSEYLSYLKKSKENPTFYYVDGFEGEQTSKRKKKELSTNGKGRVGHQKRTDDCDDISLFDRLISGQFWC